jgi:hypothetical protein
MGDDGMKLCKDCKYHEPYALKFLGIPVVTYSKLDKCKHELSADPVTGKGGQYCDTSRMFNKDITKCTPEGRYWEAKKTAATEDGLWSL